MTNYNNGEYAIEIAGIHADGSFMAMIVQKVEQDGQEYYNQIPPAFMGMPEEENQDRIDQKAFIQDEIDRLQALSNAESEIDKYNQQQMIEHQKEYIRQLQEQQNVYLQQMKEQAKKAPGDIAYGLMRQQEVSDLSDRQIAVMDAAIAYRDNGERGLQDYKENGLSADTPAEREAAIAEFRDRLEELIEDVSEPLSRKNQELAERIKQAQDSIQKIDSNVQGKKPEPPPAKQSNQVDPSLANRARVMAEQDVFMKYQEARYKSGNKVGKRIQTMLNRDRDERVTQIHNLQQAMNNVRNGSLSNPDHFEKSLENLKSTIQDIKKEIEGEKKHLGKSGLYQYCNDLEEKVSKLQSEWAQQTQVQKEKPNQPKRSN